MPISTELSESMTKAIVEGDGKEARRLAQEALDKGMDPVEAIEKGFVPGLKRMGELFDQGEVFLPELMMAGEAMKEAVSVLGPVIREAGGGGGNRPVVVMGTVEGDLHEIGKNIICIMLETEGFEVVDLGMDVDTEDFVKAARDNKASVVGASALLTTTMEHQRELVKAVKDAGLDVKVVVGGAPITKDWADEIGAHGYAENAKDAVELVLELTRGGSG
jgi:corrinoid protein of di/trimethylamine methyltransferase